MRFQKINMIRKKLQNHQVSIGTWQQIPSASISEIFSNAGYDWVAVDMEHGSISVDQLPSLFRAIELGDTLPLARIAESKPKDCKQALDAGAGGIIAPMIESAEQLKMVRHACCWPPVGFRGVGFSRANLFGKNFDSYKKEAQSPLLIAQIEHINAVNNLDEILQVDGLDAIIVGPYDLSASMGKPGKYNEKDVQDALKLYEQKSIDLNIPMGYHVVEVDYKKFVEMHKKGYRFLALSYDAMYLGTIVRENIFNLKKLLD